MIKIEFIKKEANAAVNCIQIYRNYLEIEIISNVLH